jgi:ABC-type polysaccharide/polyol phosphate transport system ATPase subunit
VISVRAERLTKTYRRYGRKRSVGTLKSALLSGFGLKVLSPDSVFTALDGVSFEIRRGESVGVIGENGSGKSTLLKLLAGILKPSSGSVETQGRVAALIELGAGFHPEITARENIEINGMLLGLSKKEIAARFESIVSFAGISEFLEEPVKTFSSGMTVRLGFSIAAHVEPEILLVDEVLAVGDEAFTHRCLEKIAEFQREGRTIVVVSHDLSLVASTCPRVLRLSNGKLVADGARSEVIGRYREEIAQSEGRRRLDSAPSTQTRWGTGEATIRSVEILDGAGRRTGVLTAGEPFRVEISGQVRTPLSDFVAGVQISRIDGAVVYGSNTLLDGHVSERVEGEFRLVLEIESADLASGAYSLDVAVHASDGAPYDYRSDVLRVSVVAPEASTGVWRPRRRWILSGAGQWKR